MRTIPERVGRVRLRRLLIAGLVLAATLAGYPAGPGLPGGVAPAAAMAGPTFVDLNSATLDEVRQLPIDEELAVRIVDYRTYLRYFQNVYQLMEIEGMTPEILQRLKPLVATIPPPPEDASIARLSASYRQVRNYLGQEGSNEGLVDEYLDKMRSPENVNSMDLYDLMSYQMVSPVDATNILKARQRLGRFENTRQLRRSDGLRYYSYRNLRDFVVFSDQEMESAGASGLSGYLQTRYWETPYSNDDEELGAVALTLTSSQIFRPAWLNKVRVNGSDGFTAGALTVREYGEREWDETVKAYVGIKDQVTDGYGLKGAYFGNYRAAYGLGLVMDNTDYIHYRKTGFGFNKRILGIHGDLGRSHEYSLTGAAAELSLGRVNASFFVSSEKKAGILNPDGTINTYVTMQPRPPAEALEDRIPPGGTDPTGLAREAFKEDLVGGNVKVALAPGCFIGLTGYQANYDKGWRSDVTTLVQEGNLDLLQARDSEIGAGYTSVFALDDSLGTIETFKWRRVMGAEAQAVLGNVSVQGEYAFQQDPRNSFLDSRNPDAYIVNLFSQWENLHLLAIWRDYDLGYDNPYNRAFSNDNRYEMTLLDAPYRLNDELYTWVEANAPQPKPEKGMFLEARYRISRNLILSGLQYDQWQRKADGADMMRYTVKGEYQPLFNLRFRVRHRYSSRSENNPDDVRTYRNWETRWQLIAMLSNFNRLGFTYMTSNVMFPARPRLSGDPQPGILATVGTAGSPAHAFEARYEHNLTPGLKLTFASSVYDGFFWNFEGNEFVLLDGNGFRNWVKVESRVSQRLLFQLKVTRDHNMPVTNLDVRGYGNVDAIPGINATYIPKDQTFVRLQMDYTF